VLLNREVIAIDQQPVAGDELHSLQQIQMQSQQMEEAAQQWFTETNAQACDYPHCCPKPDDRCKHSAFPLVPLGDGIDTAADCLKLCEGHPECDVWQLGSASRGGHCVWVQNMTAWQPVATSGGRSAGCKKVTVSDHSTVSLPRRELPLQKEEAITAEQTVPLICRWAAAAPHHQLLLLLLILVLAIVEVVRSGRNLYRRQPTQRQKVHTRLACWAVSVHVCIGMVIDSKTLVVDLSRSSRFTACRPY
jgi:hypothetical protein